MKQQIGSRRTIADWRWRAVQAKNRAFDGIFCRLSCSSIDSMPELIDLSIILEGDEESVIITRKPIDRLDLNRLDRSFCRNRSP